MKSITYTKKMIEKMKEGKVMSSIVESWMIATHECQVTYLWYTSCIPDEMKGFMRRDIEKIVIDRDFISIEGRQVFNGSGLQKNIYESCGFDSVKELEKWIDYNFKLPFEGYLVRWYSKK